MLTIISSVFGALAAGLKVFLTEFKARNTPAMKANAAAVTAQTTADKIAGDVSAAAAGNPATLESDLAE